jgi:hypothetical protein
MEMEWKLGGVWAFGTRQQPENRLERGAKSGGAFSLVGRGAVDGERKVRVNVSYLQSGAEPVSCLEPDGKQREGSGCCLRLP